MLSNSIYDSTEEKYSFCKSPSKKLTFVRFLSLIELNDDIHNNNFVIFIIVLESPSIILFMSKNSESLALGVNLSS